ncbi:MAG: deoxycytidylate deaminase [Jatrophihabitans sp.]
MSKQTMLYLPVIHRSYERFLTRHADADQVLILGTGFGSVFPSITKEIRAISPDRAAALARTILPGVEVCVVEPDTVGQAVTAELLVVPDEAMMRELVLDFELATGRTVRYERTFLRWERSWSEAGQPAESHGSSTADELAGKFMRQAIEAAQASSDWWRQVGAVAVKDGTVLSVRHNRHLPSDYSPYIDGDPRNDFSRGVRPDLSTAIHAEAELVAVAARDGVVLAGAELYVSTFPCPACARLIAAAGFRRCYFAGPYAMLDGDQILKSAGVELIWVDLSGPLD